MHAVVRARYDGRAVHVQRCVTIDGDEMYMMTRVSTHVLSSITNELRRLHRRSQYRSLLRRCVIEC